MQRARNEASQGVIGSLTLRAKRGKTIIRDIEDLTPEQIYQLSEELETLSDGLESTLGQIEQVKAFLGTNGNGDRKQEPEPKKQPKSETEQELDEIFQVGTPADPRKPGAVEKGRADRGGNQDYPGQKEGNDKNRIGSGKSSRRLSIQAGNPAFRIDEKAVIVQQGSEKRHHMLKSWKSLNIQTATSVIKNRYLETPEGIGAYAPVPSSHVPKSHFLTFLPTQSLKTGYALPRHCQKVVVYLITYEI